MICENFRVIGTHEVDLECSVIHSVSFYMKPVFRTPRGIKSDYQQVRFPMTVFRNWCVSDQHNTVLAVYEREINQNLLKPSCHKINGDNGNMQFKRSGHKNLRPETKEMKEYWWWLENKNVSVERKHGDVNGKRKDSEQRKMVASSVTMKVIVRFSESVVRHKEVGSQPHKKRKKTGGKGSVALLKNSKNFAVSIFRNGHEFLGPEPFECSHHVPMEFEERSLEENLRQERCGRRDAWETSQGIHKLKEKDKATYHSPSEVRTLPARSQTKPEERKCVVDSGASMHLLHRKDLNSAELDIVRVFTNPTTVVTANGDVQTNGEPTVYVSILICSLRTNLLVRRPQSCRLVNSSIITDIFCEWTSYQKTHPHKNGRTSTATRKTMSQSLSAGASPTSLTQDSTGNSLSSPATTGRRCTSNLALGVQFRGSEQWEGDGEDPDPVQGDLLRDMPEWLEDFAENAVDEGVSASPDTPASTSRESDSKPPRKVTLVKHCILTHFPKNQRLRGMQENQPLKGSLQETHWWSITSRRKLWQVDNSKSQSFQWRRWISKQSPIRTRGARCCHSVDAIISWAYEKFFEPSPKPKVIHTERFFGTWQTESSWNHQTSMSHRSETMVLQKEQYAGLKKEILQCCCNLTWTKSGGRNPSNNALIYELFKSSNPMGKSPYERLFGESFMEQAVPFGSRTEFCPVSAKDKSKLYQFGQKVWLSLFLGSVLHAGWIRKGVLLVAVIEELEFFWCVWILCSKTQQCSGDYNSAKCC